jgi:hypothetical protein
VYVHRPLLQIFLRTFTGLTEEYRYDHTSRSSEPEAVVCPPKTLELCVAVGLYGVWLRPEHQRWKISQDFECWRLTKVQNPEDSGLDSQQKEGDCRFVVSINWGVEQREVAFAFTRRRGR